MSLVVQQKFYKFLFQMETELQQFNQERSERVRLLREKQERQLDQFDVESASMGFR